MGKVIGKICRDARYPNICEWVIQTKYDIVTGSSTVFYGIGGNRYGTFDESSFCELRKAAENKELAGEIYKIYTMKELFDLKSQLDIVPDTTNKYTQYIYAAMILIFITLFLCL